MKMGLSLSLPTTRVVTIMKPTTSNPIGRTESRVGSEGASQPCYTIEFYDEEERDKALSTFLDPAGWVEECLTAEIDAGADRHWIQTFTGQRFCPAAPDVEHINLEDIAHALSNLSRYCGHSSSFYSVAEHSILVASEMVKLVSGDEGKDVWSLWDTVVPETELQMIHSAFLHDAPEAYVGDVTSPLKRLCKGYRIIEKRVELAVQKRFNLKFALDIEEIGKCDIAVFLAEKVQLMGDEVAPWGVSGEPAEVGKLDCWTPHKAKEMFLRAAKCLGL
jgi:hypothetical protein